MERTQRPRVRTSRAAWQALVMLGVAGAVLVPGPGLAQSADSPSIPRTPWGDPDLQGVWDFATLTPLERPPGVELRNFTEEEAAEFERQFQERLERGSFVHPPRLLDFGSRVTDDRRTSLIVSPVSGRIPPLTEAAAARVASPPLRVRSHPGGCPPTSQQQIDRTTEAWRLVASSV